MDLRGGIQKRLRRQACGTTGPPGTRNSGSRYGFMFPCRAGGGVQVLRAGIGRDLLHLNQDGEIPLVHRVIGSEGKHNNVPTGEKHLVFCIRHTVQASLLPRQSHSGSGGSSPGSPCIKSLLGSGLQLLPTEQKNGTTRQSKSREGPGFILLSQHSTSGSSSGSGLRLCSHDDVRRSGVGPLAHPSQHRHGHGFGRRSGAETVVDSRGTEGQRAVLDHWRWRSR